LLPGKRLWNDAGPAEVTRQAGDQDSWGIEPSQQLGRDRWKAERTIAWLAGCRRLRIRYDRDSERFLAFAMLACDRLCYNRLPCAATARLP
jgi:hypothetical protein